MHWILDFKYILLLLLCKHIRVSFTSWIKIYFIVYGSGCNSVVCQNNGECFDHGYDLICECPTDFSGFFCENYEGRFGTIQNNKNCHTDVLISTIFNFVYFVCFFRWV